MSNLWTQAMPWIQDPEDAERRTPVSTRHVGFAGIVGPGDDSDVWDWSMPQTTRSEVAYLIQHEDYPAKYKKRHEQAFEYMRKNRSQEDTPDISDPRLHHFLRHHWSDPWLWKKKGTFGEVSLHQPIYTTQTHVAQEHLDKYHQDPTADVRDAENRTDMDRLAPMLVKHEGRLHAIEGNHRLGAAMRRGDPSIRAWTFDLDKHHMAGYDDDRGHS